MLQIYPFDASFHMRKYFFRNPTILNKRLLMSRFSSFFSSSSPCNSFPNCCLPNLRELYFGIYRTFCVLSPKAAGQFYCSYFSCHMYMVFLPFLKLPKKILQPWRSFNRLRISPNNCSGCLQELPFQHCCFVGRNR